MAIQLCDRRDVDFVLHEQLNVTELSKNEKFESYNKKTVDMIVTEARKLSINEILPTMVEGDRQGCTFEGGQVKIPQPFYKLWEIFKEGEWVAMTEDPEWGGQGMPRSVALAASEHFNAANYPFMMYPGLTHGCGKLIESFGTPEQKKVFLKNVYTGKWTGTMLLTEACAGSDVGALETKAIRNADGTYNIEGSKIFISGGEHDMAENIIHPVLARIEGAPEGTRGISLFLVPKFLVNADGSIGAFNNVECTGIEHKMGIHGNATCSLTLGGKGACLGTLLGEENKGMAHMFLMMNEARQLVGLQGFGCASASYVNAVGYAKERVQGKAITDPKGPGVPIIQHPDVRRQLMIMKSYVEGMRSTLYYLAYCHDMAEISATPEEKEMWEGLTEVITPIGKGYVTDKAFDVCSHGMQVYGGYGFVEEYPQAQLMRDCRITMIYEGTNGIQSMDLLGRKLGMKKGKSFMDFLGQMNKTVKMAKDVPALEAMTAKVDAAVKKLGEVAMQMAKTAMSDKVLNAFAFSHPFLEATGDVTMAWMLLWRAAIAQPKIGQKKKDDAFYEGIVKSLQYFANSVLPVTLGKMEAILACDGAVNEIPEDAFAS